MGYFPITTAQGSINFPKLIIRNYWNFTQKYYKICSDMCGYVSYLHVNKDITFEKNFSEILKL